jgi:hypothetical protein
MQGGWVGRMGREDGKPCPEIVSGFQGGWIGRIQGGYREDAGRMGREDGKLCPEIVSGFQGGWIGRQGGWSELIYF